MPHIRYWCHRLMPLIKSTAPSTNDGGGGGGCRQQPTRSRIIVAIANRVGSERGDVVFCGSSCVLEFKNGGVKLLGCLDHRQEAVLILNLNDADAMPVIQQL